MEDMNNINKINEVIKALDSVKKAEPSKAFLDKMEKFAIAYSNKINSFSRETIMGMAASFLILFAVNVYAVNKYTSENSNTSEKTETEAYNLIPTKSIY